MTIEAPCRLVIRCGWCGDSMGTKPAQESGETTGLCQECLDHWFPEEEGPWCSACNTTPSHQTDVQGQPWCDRCWDHSNPCGGCDKGLAPYGETLCLPCRRAATRTLFPPARAEAIRNETQQEKK